MVRNNFCSRTATGRPRFVLTPLLWRAVLCLTLVGSLTSSALAQLTVTPTPVGFGNQAVNVASGVQTVTITNTGATAQTITGVSFTGAGAAAFTAAPITFPVILQPGQSLPVDVTFTPTGTGEAAATLDISVEGGTTQTVNLAGTGALPAGVSVSPTTVTFVNQGVNTTSGVQTIVVCGSDAAPLGITSVTTTGDFTVLDTGTQTLAQGACALIRVRFRPTATGARSGTLTINTSAGPVVVTLTGTGAAAQAPGPLPRIILPEGVVLFPALPLCATIAKPRGFDIANTGSADLTINNVTITGPAAGDYQVIQNCTSPLGRNRMCRFTLLFTPTSVGTRTAFLTINSNAGGDAIVVPLIGTGQGPGLSVSSSNVIFNQVTGTTGTQTITLTNPGTAPITISTLDVTGTTAGSFTLTPVTLPLVIAPGASQTVTVNFAPGTPGLATATLGIGTGAACPTRIVLTGTGLVAGTAGQAPTGVLALSPAALVFGGKGATGTGNTQTVNFTNVGSAPLTVTGASFVGAAGGFALAPLTYPFTLQPGQSMPLSVIFTPTAGVISTATLEVATSAGPQSITLTGTGP